MSSFISVVIATRNRGDNVVHTVNSLLENDYPCFEILVIDQSVNRLSQQAMQKFSDEPRVIYQHTQSAGMAKARNMAIAQAKGDIIAITDDDCVVSKGWLKTIDATFCQHPQVHIWFGNVLPGSFDSSAGFIPSYCRDRSKIVSSPFDKSSIDGIGACMALRRDIWQTLHGFDEMLGVGGQLKSSSEGDLVIHALNKGYRVGERPEISVIHNGFRTWEQGTELIGRYWYGTSAMYGKHLKLYPVSTFLTLVLLAWRWAFGSSRVADSLGPDSRKRDRLYAFISGFFRGLSIQINRETGHFSARSSASIQPQSSVVIHEL